MLVFLGWIGCERATTPTTLPGDDDDDTTVTDGPTGDTGTPPSPTGDTGEPPEPLPLLVVNEVQAGNSSTGQAADGTTPDWLELYNADTVPIALSRIQLRNAAHDVWVGTAEDGELGPGERRVLWLGVGTGGGVWTGFPLDRDGDELVVIVDDRLSETVEVPAMGSDLSLSRLPDLTGELALTALPTPGEPNLASTNLDPADATVFVTDRVHRIDFNCPADTVRELSNYDRPEVHTRMVIDGIHYADIGLKLKGSASYQSMNGKPAFIVDLNQWVPGTKYRGLQAFKLHNGNVYDPTRVHDHLSYGLARAAGLMAPRVGWAQVFVNGEDYGIYMLIEDHDDQFVKYHHPTQEETGVILEPNEGGAGWGDFGQGTVLDWNMEEGPLPPDPASVESLTMVDQIVARNPTDANVAQLWQYADKELVLTYLAWEAIANHYDGYKAVNNWRVFVDGDTHLVSLVPSGAEMTWTTQVQPWWFMGRLGRFCLDNDGCRHDFAAHLVTIADLAESRDMVQDFVDVSTVIDPYIQADPRYDYTYAVDSERDRTVEHLRDNPDEVRQSAFQEYPDLRP